MKVEDIVGNQLKSRVTVKQSNKLVGRMNEGDLNPLDTIQVPSEGEKADAEAATWMGADIQGSELAYREFIQDQIREAAIGNAFFLTIAFTYRQRDREAIRAIRHILRCIHRYLYDARWEKDKSKYLRGIIVAEPHRKSHSLRGSLHFHLVLKLPLESIVSAEQMEEAVNYAIVRTYMSNGVPITTMDSVKIEPVVSPDALAVYLTKTANYLGWHRLENVCWFEGAEIDAFIIPDQRPIG